jgi:hypothetical protein
MRETQRTLLQQEEYPLFQAIDIGFGRYLNIVVIDRSFGEFYREKIGSKSYAATKSTIARPKR